MLLFIGVKVQTSEEEAIFQYISCYCLSRCDVLSEKAVIISIHLMLLFILTSRSRRTIRINFNTSHVTVYPGKKYTWTLTKSDFNTSHVTVYQGRKGKARGVYRFQYISCYCLSR